MGCGWQGWAGAGGGRGEVAARQREGHTLCLRLVAMGWWPWAGGQAVGSRGPCQGGGAGGCSKPWDMAGGHVGAGAGGEGC